MRDRTKMLKLVDLLIRAEVLGSEHCPERDYWSWPVLKLDYLPLELKPLYEQYGEIRLYWI